ncbi:hypothetical protein [Haloechinothrix halophila]|uniref:Uncharacterized protein n=1 Tax=Haloechinothrix halophila YIM 93223 TaxID=592678 RepID=W9DN54_9PSEU|nr:hypothetical protein [Haloechinothrix halophila]ETA66280.1 hypothetical protein AmyhaDRAFT_0033 [Haloechinothrix halophila YIM 93223]
MTALGAVTRVMATVGNGVDRAAGAVRDTPATLRAALSHRRGRRVFGIASAVILLLYLLAIGDIALSASGRWAAEPLARVAPDALFQSRAPWLYEPVVELHPGAHVAVFASPVNLLFAAIVASLAGLNLALAAHAAQQAVACRRPGYSRSLAVLPAFMLGIACCAPTFVLALGAGTAAAIVPVLVPLRPWFYPLTLALLLVALVWGVYRVRTLARADQSGESVASN